MLNKYFNLLILLILFQTLWSQDASFTFHDNDFVNIGSASTIQPSTAMTIECWVNPEITNYDDFDPIIQYLRLAGADQESGFALIYYEDQFRFILSVGSGQNDIYGDGLQLWPGFTLELNTWTHIAGTYDSQMGIARIFKNGIEQASFSTAGGPINWSYIDDMEMKIAKSINTTVGSADGYFSGMIDEVRLWDIALNANTIENEMCVTQDPNNPNLMGYWNFNDGNDNTIEDLTGNGNDGILNNEGEGYWDSDVYENATPCIGTGACVDSVIASLPFFHSSMLNGTMGNDWPSDTFPDGVDYAYQLTLATPKKLYIDTCDPITDFDTFLSIKDTCGNAIGIVDEDDGLPDFCPESGIPENPHYASIIDSVYLPEGTYYIILDGWGGATGNYAIAVGTLPEIVSSLIAEDDSFLEIHFSENMFTDATGSGALEPSDFEISFDQNGGTATGVSIDYIANANGEPLSSGEDTVRFYISVIGESTGQEEITIFPQNNASIFNSFGIGLLRSASITQGLSDQNPPTVISTIIGDGSTDVSLSSNIVIQLSESLYNNETGDSITANDFFEYLTLKYGDSLGVDIPFNISLNDSTNELIIDPISNFLGDTTVYFHFYGAFVDARGNEAVIDVGLIIETLDNIPPTSLAYILADDNSYIDLQFSDQIFGDSSASVPLQSDHIQAIVTSNGSLVDTCSITSVSRIDSYDLIGGEINVRVNLEYNQTPTGNEYIVLVPSDSMTLFDESGNTFSGESFTSSLQLYDILPPSIDSISVSIDSFIVLMESTPITFSFNENVDSIGFSVTSGVMDSVNFSTFKTDSSIQIVLQPPFASFDSIVVYFSYLEDGANLTTVDIAYTFHTPILGDYDLDNVISYNDMWDLVENWELKNYNYELGPFTGTVPHYIFTPDSKFDIEDGMAFIKIWSWYQNTYGEINQDTTQVGRRLNFFQNGTDLSIILSDSIKAGRLEFIYSTELPPFEFYPFLSKDKELYLTSHFPDRGYSILEFARAGIFSSDTIQLSIDLSTKIELFYSFNNFEETNFQKGIININHRPVPNKVALYPAYPNPFNPVTTIKFDIPITSISEKISLTIFDIQGREIESLINGKKSPGSYELKWEANEHASGMYLARLIHGNSIQTQKILLLK